MNEYNKDFKGVWFPKDLWLDRNISLTEKSILIAIYNLGWEYSSATNNEIADFVQCSAATVSRAITRLKNLWYIEDVWDWEFWMYRVLRLTINAKYNSYQEIYKRNALILNAYYQNEEELSNEGFACN